VDERGFQTAGNNRYDAPVLIREGDVRRRDFIAGLGGAAVVGPRGAWGQQSERMRRMGFLLSQSFDNEEAKQRLDAIRDGLQKLGWSEGRNLVIEARYASGSADRLQAFAAELVKVEPDVLFASATASLAALHKATQSIPIVFAQVTDPVGAGFVKSLARPGGNITGFTQHDFSIGVKWLELLKELSAKTDRVAIIYDPQNPATAGYLSAIKDAEQQFQVRLSGHPVRDAAEIEDAIDTVAKAPNSGLVILPGPVPSIHRAKLIALANKHLLPAVYPFRYWTAAGGLAFYGIDNIELHRQAASYLDRIFKGEKPGDLPIQNATKFELVLNLKTAKLLGINPPNSLLARTDEVIE